MNDYCKDRIEVDFDWVDSNAFVKGEDGQLIPAGTAIKLISQILFLSPLSDSDLEKLKYTVVTAVDHELAKRPPK